MIYYCLICLLGNTLSCLGFNVKLDLKLDILSQISHNHRYMKKTFLYFLLIYSSLIAAGEPLAPQILEVEEVTAPRTEGELHTAHRYQIRCKNCPLECPALFVQESVGGVISSTPAYLKEDGVLALRREGYPTLYFTDENLGVGEPVTLNVIPCDRSRSVYKPPVYASYKFIPRPLQAVSPSGVILTCEVADLTKQSFFIKVSGLDSGEEVHFSTPSEGHVVEFRESADEKGEILFVDSISGSSGGSYEITATNSRIGSLSVRY